MRQTWIFSGVKFRVREMGYQLLRRRTTVCRIEGVIHQSKLKPPCLRGLSWRGKTRTADCGSTTFTKGTELEHGIGLLFDNLQAVGKQRVTK